jgi:hypothetical protein
MTFVLVTFRLFLTLAFAKASPNVRRGDFRGGGRGPIHDFP